MGWLSIFRKGKPEVKQTRGLRVIDKIRKPKPKPYEADVLICYLGKPVSKMKVIENGETGKHASAVILKNLTFKVDKIHQKK